MQRPLRTHDPNTSSVVARTTLRFTSASAQRSKSPNPLPRRPISHCHRLPDLHLRQFSIFLWSHHLCHCSTRSEFPASGPISEVDPQTLLQIPSHTRTRPTIVSNSRNQFSTRPRECHGSNLTCLRASMFHSKTYRCCLYYCLMIEKRIGSPFGSLRRVNVPTPGVNLIKTWSNTTR